MFSKSIRFLKSNIQISIIYLIIVVLANVVSINLEGAISFIIMLCAALLALNFFITVSELIEDESSIKSIKGTFLRFDKDIVIKIVILIVFLSVIFLIFKGPMIFITMTPLKDKFATILKENQVLFISLGVVTILFTSFYKMLFLASIANIIYFKGDTIESLKGGFKTTFKLKTLLLLFILISASDAFISFAKENQMIIAYCVLAINILLTLFLFLMAFYYFREIEETLANPNN
jgi:hypothetical protein